jgi:hypothetical protein
MEELKEGSYQRLVESNLLQVSPARSPKDPAGAGNDNFNGGVIDFNWSIGGRYAWIPAKSYFRIGLSIYNDQAATTQPTPGDKIAFADDVCACLFNNIYFRAGGQDVSSIVNYVPQASILKNRVTKSGAWLRSTGSSAYGLDANFEDRIKQISAGTENNYAVQRKTLKIDAAHTIELKAQNDDNAVISAGDYTTRIATGDIIEVEGVMYKVITAPTTAADPAPRTFTVKNLETYANPPAVAAATNFGIVTTGIVTTTTAQGRNKVWFNWVPPIGIFDEYEPMGSGDYRLQLNPNANYKKACVQAEVNKALSTYNLKVDDIQFFAAIEKNTLPASMTKKLSLMEMQIQTKKIEAGTASVTLDWTLPPSTQAITVFVQSRKAGAENQVPPTRFKTEDDRDENLQTFQITYANTTKPSTKWDSELSANTNHISQRYLDSQMETGRLFSEGGCETLDEFLHRGAYYHYNFTRDSSDRSTNCQLQLNFGAPGLSEEASVFLVSHFSRVATITTQDGRVVAVESLSV